MLRAGESESRLQSTAHPQQLRLETLAIDDSADITAGQPQDALPKTYNDELAGDGWLAQISWAGADDPQPPRFGQARNVPRLRLTFESEHCTGLDAQPWPLMYRRLAWAHTCCAAYRCCKCGLAY